jgi:two-component system, NtrC family, response regulator HydG
LPEQFNVLIVSASIEDRRALMHVLNKLSTNVISCSTLRQAEEVLSQQPIDAVFCDQRLPDGTYRDLLAVRPVGQKMPRVVVTTRVGGWEDYAEATRLGAFDVIPCPLRPTDIELAVIRAMHSVEQKPAYATA